MTDEGVGGVPEEVAGVIRGFGGRGLHPQAADLVRQAVELAGPKSRERGKALLWAAAQLAAFGESVGLQQSLEVLFHPSVIERFILTGTRHMSPAARRTLRTNLRHMGIRILPVAYPLAVALPRERSKRPYSQAELASYLFLADAQPTIGRRMRTVGLICLGAGCGLVGRDLAAVRGTDVVCRSGGVLVQVQGARARVVPVLSCYHERLLASAEFAGDCYVIGGKKPDRRNVTNALVAKLSGGADLARLETARLRATWIATVAEVLGLPAFMAAAGVSCSQRIGDVVANLQVVGEAEAVALLGATR